MVLISLLAMPALVLAANGGGAMAEMPSLSQRMMMLAIQLGVILVAARIGSQIFEHFNLPGVLGELCIGILIGPSLLGGIPIPWSQTFSQRLQPMQPLAQILRVRLPLSLLEQATKVRTSSPAMRIRFFGHLVMQVPQPVQVVRSMSATPSTM